MISMIIRWKGSSFIYTIACGIALREIVGLKKRTT